MNYITFHSYPGQWFSYNYKGRETLAGNFFYGEKDYVPEEDNLRKKIRNDSIYCIPAIEPFWHDPAKRSQMAIDWLNAVMSEAKRVGLTVNISYELREPGFEYAVATSKAIIEEYPLIDGLELISEEDIETYIDQIKNNITCTAEIRKNLNGRKIQFLNGIYNTTSSELRTGFDILRNTPDKDVIITVLPAHGARMAVKNLSGIPLTSEDLNRTMIYSWIEFDGLMYLQQNPVEGIRMMIEENLKRRQPKPYDPRTGEGAYGERERIYIEDAHFPYMWLPKEMMKEKLVKELIKYKTFKSLIIKLYGEFTLSRYEQAWIMFCEIRFKYDFEFFAIIACIIQDKESGNKINFKLNRGQRRLLAKFEEMRARGVPIRIILLKARQYGGSTFVQVYMDYIQIIHKKNWSSVICAHVKDAAITIRGMYEDLITNMIPIEGKRLHIKNYKQTQNIKEVPERGCRITVGSAEEPDSVRSQDVKMAHFSEVAKYPNTEKKGTSKLIGSIVGTIPKIPYTFICFESTANGEGDFFHEEWKKAKNGHSSYEPCFVPWYMIEMYSNDFDGTFYNHEGRKEIGTIEEFSKTLNEYELRLFYTYECTLENINWYRGKRGEMTSDEEMFQDFPTDDEEAFLHSGMPCFKADHIERLRVNCTNPIIGDLIGESSPAEARIDPKKRKSCLNGLIFKEDKNATEGYKSSHPKIRLKSEVNKLKVWELPEQENISHRYLVSYDPNKGITDKADFGVIRVFDRSDRMYGGVSRIVAEWRGHEDKDIAIWTACQIAEFYNRAK